MSSEIASGGIAGGAAAAAGGAVNKVDGNSPDNTGNAVSTGYKTVAQLTTAVNGASAADKTALVTALGLNNALLNT